MVLNRPDRNIDEHELRQLFHRIDINEDGRISSSDILRLLKKHHGESRNEIHSQIAESFISRCNSNSTQEITFCEFMNYVLEHDKRLSVAFDHLDSKKTGYVTSEDIKETFHRFGIELSNEEANRLLRRVDQTGSLTMDYNQWREFFLFHPAENVSKLFEYWCLITLDPSGDADVGFPATSSSFTTPTARQLLQLAAGAIAGAVSRTCTAPIDRLKLMRQVHGYKHKGSGFVEAYSYMLREGGFFSLWRGNGINVLKIAPETALKYGSYEHYKRFLSSPEINHHWFGGVLTESPLLTEFLAGSLAGSTAQTMIYPLEVLKTRMCLRKTGQFDSIWHCARTVYQEHGISTFYRGYFVNLLGGIPYAGIELALYENCRSAYINHFLPDSAPNLDPPHLPTYVVPLLGSFSSACGIIVTYPASLIRAKLQAVYWSQTSHQKVTALNLLRTIWMDDGIFGFYRGLFTNLVKVLPAASISLATYETLRRQFNLGPLGSG